MFGLLLKGWMAVMPTTPSNTITAAMQTMKKRRNMGTCGAFMFLGGIWSGYTSIASTPIAREFLLLSEQRQSHQPT